MSILKDKDVSYTSSDFNVVSPFNLDDDIPSLRRYIRSQEADWKKNKAVLEQRIEILEEQLKSSKDREENLSRMNSSILSAVNERKTDNTSSSLMEVKLAKELEMLSGSHLREINDIKFRFQEQIRMLEKENSNFQARINHQDLLHKEITLDYEKQILMLNQQIHSLEREKSQFIMIHGREGSEMSKKLDEMQKQIASVKEETHLENEKLRAEYDKEIKQLKEKEKKNLDLPLKVEKPGSYGKNHSSHTAVQTDEKVFEKLEMTIENLRMESEDLKRKLITYASYVQQLRVNMKGILQSQRAISAEVEENEKLKELVAHLIEENKMLGEETSGLIEQIHEKEDEDGKLKKLLEQKEEMLAKLAATTNNTGRLKKPLIGKGNNPKGKAIVKADSKIKGDQNSRTNVKSLLITTTKDSFNAAINTSLSLLLKNQGISVPPASNEVKPQNPTNNIPKTTMVKENKQGGQHEQSSKNSISMPYNLQQRSSMRHSCENEFMEKVGNLSLPPRPSFQSVHDPDALNTSSTPFRDLIRPSKQILLSSDKANLLKPTYSLKVFPDVRRFQGNSATLNDDTLISPRAHSPSGLANSSIHDTRLNENKSLTFNQLHNSTHHLNTDRMLQTWFQKSSHVGHPKHRSSINASGILNGSCIHENAYFEQNAPILREQNFHNKSLLKAENEKLENQLKVMEHLLNDPEYFNEGLFDITANTSGYESIAYSTAQSHLHSIRKFPEQNAPDSRHLIERGFDSPRSGEQIQSSYFEDRAQQSRGEGFKSHE